MIAFLREQEISLPINSHILIAISGGPDSTALAHMLIHYGRKIIDRGKISLLHINHNWRESASQDEKFVQNLAKLWNVECLLYRLDPPSQKTSLEQQAREARKKIFLETSQLKNAKILTAHHANDLAETLLWRIMTGSFESHRLGIAFQHGVEMRPFLVFKKSEIEDYLKEVHQSFQIDETNFCNRFLRAKIRSKIMPPLLEVFPKAIEHLTELALKAQKIKKNNLTEHPLDTIFEKSSNFRWKRSHFQSISHAFEKSREEWHGEVHLPDGWKLIREKKGITFKKKS
jgi:tRNA(Ile)-lysidine synthase